MTATIYILHDRRYDTAISYLEVSLREVFQDTVEIQEVTKADLNNNHIWSPDNSLLFITPPIMGEKCHYNELYTQSVSQKRFDYVRNGGITLDLCAGAYHAFPQIQWRSPTNGEAKNKPTNAKLFKGTSYGPLEGLGRPTDPENRYSDCIITPIEASIEGKTIELACYYGNGCSFILEDPEVETLVRYAHNKEKPPAIIRKNIEKGFAIASGILPHYPYQQQTIPALNELNEQIKPHEKNRRLLIQSIWGEIARHGVQRDLITDTPRHLKTPLAHLKKITPL